MEDLMKQLETIAACLKLGLAITKEERETWVAYGFLITRKEKEANK